MSGKIMGKVWDLDLPHNQLLVLLAMADHADHLGDNVYPSLGLIGWKTGYSEQQVRRVIRQLVALKILIVVSRSPGRPVKYKIDLSAGTQKEEYTPDKMSPLPKSNPLHPERAENTSTPDMLSAKNVGEPSIEPSINTLAVDTAQTAKPETAVEQAVKHLDTVEPKRKPIPSSEMNPMKDAIAAAFGYSWSTMTHTEKGLVQKAAKDLCEVKVTPDEIPSLYAYCKRMFTSFKPMALPGNVSEWRKTRPSNIIRIDGYIPVEERTSVLDGIRLS